MNTEKLSVGDKRRWRDGSFFTVLHVGNLNCFMKHENGNEYSQSTSYIMENSTPIKSEPKKIEVVFLMDKIEGDLTMVLRDSNEHRRLGAGSYKEVHFKDGEFYEI